jgi:hypothetical protein
MTQLTILKPGSYLNRLGIGNPTMNVAPLFQGVYGSVNEEGKFFVDPDLSRASYFFSLIAAGVVLPTEAVETIEVDEEVGKSLRASLTACLKWNWARAYDSVPSQNPVVTTALANERQIALTAADQLIANLGVQLYAVDVVLENCVVSKTNHNEGKFEGNGAGPITIAPTARLMTMEETSPGSPRLESSLFDTAVAYDEHDMPVSLYAKMTAEIIVPATNPEAAVALATLFNSNAALRNLILNENNGVIRPKAVLALSENPFPAFVVAQLQPVPAALENTAQATQQFQQIETDTGTGTVAEEEPPEYSVPAIGPVPPIVRDRSGSNGFFGG